MTPPEIHRVTTLDLKVRPVTWPVAAEPFGMWVLEDDFADGRPALDKAGVRLVDDVSLFTLATAPGEMMVVRIL